MSNSPCRSLKILEQWRLKAALHSTNAVFIELGNDFTYALKEDSHLMYDNYKVFLENHFISLRFSDKKLKRYLKTYMIEISWYLFFQLFIGMQL